jgi:hypothetical protein
VTPGFRCSKNPRAAAEVNFVITENGRSGAGRVASLRLGPTAVRAFQPSCQCCGIDEIDESPLSVDLHDRQPLAVGGLELRVAGDVDLVEGLAALGEDGARPLAEVAALGREEDDPRRYG